MAQAVASGRQIRIGDYLLIGKIGQGGNAQIFKARQESLGREVAIKVLSAKLSDDSKLSDVLNESRS